MSTLYLYLDESGDLGKLGSHYFIIALVCSENPNELKRCIKRLRMRKLKKQIKELSEIKANNSNRLVREYLLKQFMKTDSEIHIIAIDKSTVYDYLFDHKQKLYNYIVGILMDDLEIQHKNVDIIVDKKDASVLSKSDFNQYLTNKLNEKRFGTSVRIYHVESHTCQQLQVVDFIAWAAHRKFSYGDDSYYKIIEPKIKGFIHAFRQKQ